MKYKIATAFLWICILLILFVVNNEIRFVTEITKFGRILTSIMIFFGAAASMTNYVILNTVGKILFLFGIVFYLVLLLVTSVGGDRMLDLYGPSHFYNYGAYITGRVLALSALGIATIILLHKSRT